MTGAFGIAWGRIVYELHPILKSLNPAHERTFEETRNDIVASFANFKPEAQIRKNFDFGEFSLFLKRQVQSRLMAVAAMPTAFSGAASGATAPLVIHAVFLFFRYFVYCRDPGSLSGSFNDTQKTHLQDSTDCGQQQLNSIQSSPTLV